MIRNKKSPIIMTFIVIVLLLGVGYAYLNSNLSINGTTNVTSSSWDVHWNNLNVSTGSVTGSQVTTPAYIKSGLTEVEYNITLSQPGDYYEFTVDAVNSGSIDAMIESFSNKVYQSNGTTERTQPTYLNFTVTYADGVPLGNNHLLAANTTETYKVRVEFRTDINPSDLPSTNDSMIFKFNVTYVQANSSAIERPRVSYIYSYHPMNAYIGQPLPNGYNYKDDYHNVIDVTFYGHNMFLKHKLLGNVVEESYLGFFVDDVLYYVRGGVDESQLDSKPIYDENVNTILTSLGAENCTYTNYYHCSNDDWIITVNVYEDGTVSTHGINDGCLIRSNGSSTCG